MFGPHLIIDGMRCDTRKLADRNLVEQVLNDYPDAIGMTKIGGPYMFEYQAPDPAYSGVSGLVVIAESHIAIHTFPELDYFTMDIFSCKNFDHEHAIEYIRSAFDVKEMDRMLVQRGLSFKGPHHGKLGANDELIAAANARLANGIISKEPALPDEPPTLREAAVARAQHNGNGHNADGQMIWPQYGTTPDIGTYGEQAEGARHGAQVVDLSRTSTAPVTADGVALAVVEPIQVNPTASLSGLLDKMSATGQQGRALGRALATWERLARDEQATISLAISEPVVAEGMRQTLTYAIDRHYVDVVVAQADDLFADMYEALGHSHFDGPDGMVSLAEGREQTLAFFGELLAELDTASITSTQTLWAAIGSRMGAKVPRKGILQAAAQAGVPVVTPDLATSAFAPALLAAAGSDHGLTLDPSRDATLLAKAVADRPRLGVIRLGQGSADQALMSAMGLADALGHDEPELAATISLGGPSLGVGEQAVAVVAPVEMTLPLLVTGLAQRMTGGRGRATVKQPVPALA
ncbi:MAG TPA: adenosylmethionine decarboxylase [Ktedonobacterales bacterium]